MSSNAATTAAPGLVGLFRAFWRYAEGKRRRSIASSTLLIGSQLVKLCIPWLAAQAVNTIQTAGLQNMDRVLWLMTAILLTSVLSWALHGPGRIIERSVGIQVKSNLADGIYRHLSHLPLAWHESHHSGETLHRVDKTTRAPFDFAQNQFIYLQNFVNMAGPVFALMLLSGATGLLALCGYALIGYVIVRFDRVLMRLVEKQNTAERRYSAAMVDCLGFRYARARENAPSLDRVSIAFHRGERVALVGASGSGKSTLMRVLAGLYDAEAAVFRVDGTACPELRHLGDIATLIPQDAEVFEGSVRDNITFGVDYPPETLREAICIAGFEPVIASLPQGLDTVISERGLNLSGGQKQRMALARGILAGSRSSLLFLDEPTSSLDPVTEARIFTGLGAAFPEACIVCSVHRLNLLPRFDRIVLMSEGSVLDAGRVDELLKRSPLFRELWHRSTGADAA